MAQAYKLLRARYIGATSALYWKCYLFGIDGDTRYVTNIFFSKMKRLFLLQLALVLMDAAVLPGSGGKERIMHDGPKVAIKSTALNIVSRQKNSDLHEIYLTPYRYVSTHWRALSEFASGDWKYHRHSLHNSFGKKKERKIFPRSLNSRLLIRPSTARLRDWRTYEILRFAGVIPIIHDEIMAPWNVVQERE